MLYPVGNSTAVPIGSIHLPEIKSPRTYQQGCCSAEGL
ncbi:hypothetical protein FLA_5528 [Filimonas lacunae]|nr:hypothetical protein FLA_5528 [Filimonas lacunae]